MLIQQVNEVITLRKVRTEILKFGTLQWSVTWWIFFMSRLFKRSLN